MTNVRVYRYSAFIREADFPFDFRIRTNHDLPTEIHAHDHLQICYINKGECLHLFRGKQVPLVKGDIFSIPPFFEHHIMETPGIEVEIFQIDFMPFFINEHMKDIERLDGFFDFAYIQPFIYDNEDLLTPKLNLSARSRGTIERLIQQMKEEMDERNEGYKLAIKAYLLELLVVISRESKRYLRDRQEASALDFQRLSRVIPYIYDHYHEELKLEDMAKAAFMSVPYFCTVFKEITGSMFTEYVNNIRIQYAMDHLTHSDCTVTEIYMMTGFNNMAYFNRTFKKITGVTPTSYRRLSRG